MQAHMARRWAWLFVAAIVIVDVVVIATALRDGGKTRQSTASPATRQSAPLYPAPEMVAPTRLSTETRPGNPTIVRGLGTSPLAEPLPPATPAPDPSGIQVLGVSRTAEPERTTAAAPPAPSGGRRAPSERPRMLVDLADDGSVVRADRGACPAHASARIEVSRDFGRTWVRPELGLPQILGARVERGGAVSLVGSDSSCRPAARTSSDGGDTWLPAAVTGWWHLNPDAHSTQVVGPRMVVDTGCVPVALSATSDRDAATVCADGEIRVTSNSGDTWLRASDMPGAVDIALRPDGSGVVLAATSACGAQVWSTVDRAHSWAALVCLSAVAQQSAPSQTAASQAAEPPTVSQSVPGMGSATRAATAQEPQPEAIAIAGERIAAQVGRVLFVSADGGATWQQRSE